MQDDSGGPAEPHSHEVTQRPTSACIVAGAPRMTTATDLDDSACTLQTAPARAATIASAGAAVGTGNVLSSLIHSVARNRLNNHLVMPSYP